MATRVIDDSKLQSIAVAIQGKDGGGQMTVDEMPTRIGALTAGIKFSLDGRNYTESISFPNNITNIGAYAFYFCVDLKSIIVPSNVTAIHVYAFAHCTSLQSVLLANGVTTINNAVFDGCVALTSVVIPNSVTIINNAAFRSCTSLSVLDLSEYNDPAKIPTLNDINAFFSTPHDLRMIVKNQEMYDAFTTATNWSTYASRFQIKPSGVI